MKLKKNLLPLIFFIVFPLFIFRAYILYGHVPFPSNLLVSFYQPFASYEWEGYPFGPPSKPNGFDNLKIYYPHRSLTTDQYKNLEFPLWNPYIFSGNTLLGAYQTAVFHPMAFLFLILPQIDAWSAVIIFQPILTGLFTFYYLKEIKLNKPASFFGAVVFAYSGIMVVWWEEMFMAVYSILFLPLVLLGIEKIYKKVAIPGILFLVLGLSMSIFSGWFQATFYLYSFSFIYALFLFIKNRKLLNNFLAVIYGFIISLIISSIQLIPGIEAYLNSVRSTIDTKGDFEVYLQPVQKLITFIAPDYFGNSAVHNYYGPGFYHEHVIFIGIPALLLLIYEYFHFRKNSAQNQFYKVAAPVLLSLSFALPTSWLLLYYLPLPFLSEMNPSRITLLSSFTFSVIAAYGMNRFLTDKLNVKRLILSSAIIFLFFVIGWLTAVYFPPKNDPLHEKVPFRNMIFPTLIFASLIFVIILRIIKPKLKMLSYLLILALTLFGILYFTNKYLYFSEKKFVFPEVPLLTELEKIAGINRVYTVGDAFIYANLLLQYNLFSADGYDSFNPGAHNEFLYSTHANGKLSDEMPRANAEIYKSKNIDEINDNPYRLRAMEILGVKYVIASNQDVNTSDEFEEVWNDGKFKIFEFKNSLPRMYFTDKYAIETDKQEILDKIYTAAPSSTVVLEKEINLNQTEAEPEWEIVNYDYKPNRISIRTKTNKDLIFVLSDNYYPGWKAYVDGKETEIFRANYSFRAVKVPEGEHKIDFVYKPKSFAIGSLASAGGIVLLIVSLVFLNKQRPKFKKDKKI